MDKKYLEQQIFSMLQPLNPEKVILFGSYARNTMHENSDVDLYIVSKEDFTPSTFAENMQHHKKYTRALKELKKVLPMDVLVHTQEGVTCLRSSLLSPLSCCGRKSTN